MASLTHDIFINGCQTNFDIDSHDEIEIGDLYPDVALRTIDECFNDYISNLNLKEDLEESFKEEGVPAAMVERLPVPASCAWDRETVSVIIFFPLLFCNYSSIMWIIGAWVQRKIYFLLFRNLLFVIHFVVLMEGVIFVVQLSNNPMYFSTRNYKLRETSMHWLDAYEWNLEVYIIAYHFALQTNFFFFLNNSVLFFPKAKKIIIAY